MAGYHALDDSHDAWSRDAGSLTSQAWVPHQPDLPSIRKLPYPNPNPTLTPPLTRKLSACVALVAEHPNVVAYLAQRPVTPV